MSIIPKSDKYVNLMTKPTIVYMAVNLVNGKKYIGVTAQKLEQRKRAHVKGWGKYKRPSSLHLAIEKYGEKNILFFVLKKCNSYQIALDTERFLISKWKPQYNQTAGGEGIFGHKMSDQVLKKRGEKPSPLKGKKRPQYVIDKMRIALKGKKLNLSDSALAIRRTQALKMVEENKISNRPASQKSIEHMRKQGVLKRKKVICVSYGTEFESATAASLFYGLYSTSVSHAIKKQGGKIKGLLFEYL